MRLQLSYECNIEAWERDYNYLMSAILRPGNECTIIVQQEGIAWQTGHGRTLHNMAWERDNDYLHIFGDNRIVYSHCRPHGTRWRKSHIEAWERDYKYLFSAILNSCIHPMTYVTGFAKRDHIPQILILSYKRF